MDLEKLAIESIEKSKEIILYWAKKGDEAWIHMSPALANIKFWANALSDGSRAQAESFCLYFEVLINSKRESDRAFAACENERIFKMIGGDGCVA